MGAKSADRVLYLDFDGVLHDEEVYRHPRRGIYIAKPERRLFEWMPVLSELLAPHPDIAIVLSTSWVRALSFSEAKKRLSPELQARVIGATFHSRWMNAHEFQSLPRGVQVVDDVTRRGPRAWFALDDEDVNWPRHARDNLICTDGKVGISDVFTQHAIRTMLQRL